MSDPQQLEREIREYLDKEPNLRREDRLHYLKTIFHKHLEFNKLEHVINSRDLFDIISYAKGHYSNLKLPIHISKKPIESSELPQISMIESLVCYLNKMSLLRKVIKLDYTENKYK